MEWIARSITGMLNSATGGDELGFLAGISERGPGLVVRIAGRISRHGKATMRRVKKRAVAALYSVDRIPGGC